MAILPGSENQDNSPWYAGLEEIAMEWNAVTAERTGAIEGEYNAWHVKFNLVIPSSGKNEIEIRGLKELRTLQTGLIPLNARYTWLTDICWERSRTSDFHVHVRRKSLLNRLRMIPHRKLRSVKHKYCLIRTTHPDKWAKLSTSFSEFLPFTHYFHWDEDGLRVSLYTLPKNRREVNQMFEFLDEIQRSG